jgi:hypothetical protein
MRRCFRVTEASPFLTLLDHQVFENVRDHIATSGAARSHVTAQRRESPVCHGVTSRGRKSRAESQIAYLVEKQVYSGRYGAFAEGGQGGWMPFSVTHQSHTNHG